MTGLLFTRDEANKADLRRRRGGVSLWLKVREIEVERAALFQINYSTSRGAPFSGGTQRDSSAIPLRVPASGGVWLSNLLSSPHFSTD